MKINDVKTNYNCGKNFRFCIENGTNDYLIVLFKSPCTVFTSYGYQDVLPLSLGVFSKELRQEYYCSDSEFIHDYIRFEPETDSEKLLLEEIEMHSIFSHFVDETVPLFKLAVIEFYSEGTYKYKMLSLLTNTILTKAAEYSYNSKTTHNTNERLFIRLRSELYSNPQNFPSIETAASKLHISCSYFQSLYKKQFGITFGKDLINSRLEKAKQMLVNTDYSIYNISLSCGYENVEHFCRQFRKNLDMTPNAYRKSNRKV